MYQGVWGSAPFQSVYQPAPGRLLSLTLLPEWYLLVALLAGLSALSAVWPPLRLALPLLALTFSAVVLQAVRNAARAPLRQSRRSRLAQLGMRVLVAWLHLVQPAARLWAEDGDGRAAHIGDVRSRYLDCELRHTDELRDAVLPVPSHHGAWREVCAEHRELKSRPARHR